jgi:glutamine synthetase
VQIFNADDGSTVHVHVSLVRVLSTEFFMQNICDSL